MESFFASLKKEHVHHVHSRTRAEARAAVFEYVEIFYLKFTGKGGLGLSVGGLSATAQQ
jgi:transposase InsO family protein